MKVGLIITALLIVLRIALEMAGAPFWVSSIFGVVWLYFAVPVFFAITIRTGEYSKPYGRLLKDIILFAAYTRVMVAITYVLAHYLDWTAKRFSTSQGGTVGSEVTTLPQVLFIVLRNGVLWIGIAAIVGMVSGSITFILKRRKHHERYPTE